MTKAIPEISVDAQLLYQHLSKASIGDVITWDELTEVIGRDVRNGAYGALTTARRRTLNNDHMVFEAVKGIGLKRLSDEEIVTTGESTVGRIRRAARRGIKKIASVSSFENLPNELKIRHNAFLSLFGAVETMNKPSKVKMLEDEVSKAQEQLPLAKTLETFRK